MIIDIHTHTFPDKIAENTLAKLSGSSGIIPFVNGTVQGLVDSMNKYGISHSVILPVATSPSQFETINTSALQINEKYGDKGIISFGGIHPDNDNCREKIKWLKDNGFKGIKLHPVFQRTYFDDIKYKRIVDCAIEFELVTLVHGGFDISWPELDYVTPKHILPVLKDVGPENLIFAHMGAWGCWEEMLPVIQEYKVKLDTSFSITPSVKADTMKPNTEAPILDEETFIKMVRLAGAENVFFGSDSPWTDQQDCANTIRNFNLTEEEKELILYKNAKALLNL